MTDIPKIGEYSLPKEEVPIRVYFFENQKKYRAHARRHFLNDHEPWTDCLNDADGLIFEEIKRDFTNPRMSHKSWKQLSEIIMRTLDNQIRESVSIPLYIKYHTRRITKSAKYNPLLILYLVSIMGNAIVLAKSNKLKRHHNNPFYLKTAYFYVSRVQEEHESQFSRFTTMWKKSKSKLERGEWVENVSGDLIQASNIEYVSSQHWERCPTHLIPRPSRRRYGTETHCKQHHSSHQIVRKSYSQGNSHAEGMNAPLAEQVRLWHLRREEKHDVN